PVEVAIGVAIGAWIRFCRVIGFMLLELGHALLESPLVRDGVIEIGACAIRVADSVVG
ncbi:20956_t:CDS:2, partial [Gigaspora rosea]